MSHYVGIKGGEIAVDRLCRGRFNAAARNKSLGMCRAKTRRAGGGAKGNIMVKTGIVVVALLAVPAAAMAQDVEKGAAVFKKYCSPCHRIGPDAQNLVGPELNGLDGRHSGSAPGYNYSAANQSSGIVWNEANFKEYIKNPKAKIPSTKMAFAGLKQQTDIDDLWAYLKQFDADGNIKK
jgi:cytochrome c